jgi:hypothetical protein
MDKYCTLLFWLEVWQCYIDACLARLQLEGKSLHRQNTPLFRSQFFFLFPSQWNFGSPFRNCLCSFIQQVWDSYIAWFSKAHLSSEDKLLRRETFSYSFRFPPFRSFAWLNESLPGSSLSLQRLGTFYCVPNWFFFMYRYMDWQNFFLFKPNCIFTNKSIIYSPTIFSLLEQFTAESWNCIMYVP